VSDLTADAIDKIVSLSNAYRLEQAVPDGDPFAVMPASVKIESLDKYFKPRVVRAAPQFKDVDSFIAYVLSFSTRQTVVFSNPSVEAVNFTAIIDYHEGDTPGWCSHRAVFVSELTPEFKTWRAANRKQMGQVEFATWLEDNAELFYEPSGADLLELVKNLHGHKNARFGGEVRLATGNYSVSWEEDTVVAGRGTVQGGSLAFPKMVTAGIAPFYGCPPYKVVARLKTKVEDRKLSLWYETVAEHLIMRDSINLICQKVRSELKIPVLIGTP
jgi:uncharacterized protein YfdQ (DUF2303 family)